MPNQGLTPAQETLKLLSAFAAEQLEAGVSPEETIQRLVARDMSLTDATAVVDRVGLALEKDETRNDLLAGLIQRLIVSSLWLILGLWVLLGADGDEERLLAGLGMVALGVFWVLYRLLRLIFR